jgi:hypothetical protein
MQKEYLKIVYGVSRKPAIKSNLRRITQKVTVDHMISSQAALVSNSP